MSRALEGPRRAGGVWIGAIVDTSVLVVPRGSGLHGTGSKRPLAVLVHDGRALSIYDAGGRPMPEAKAEHLCPGCAAQMRAAATG